MSCTVGMNVAERNSRFYLAELTDPLSIAYREAQYQEPHENSVQNVSCGDAHDDVTARWNPSHRDGTLCFVFATPRGDLARQAAWPSYRRNSANAVMPVRCTPVLLAA
ncbi:hypothetical protein BN2475_150138 [Paraburkholderia ribeironis]|uniref:Uncharacterized protein n=1 Tax=Paraburkholderia ribeironis TaxID=1247936 RepID=A0A1N7RTT5_9BURK|nr:hypothetical protein BN2475_150138 [Paraburkholderia ribeironis]